MKKMFLSVLKSKKGITLMTLAITIIVILILAGVTISLVIGPEGLLSNAEKSVNAYKQAEANEIELLAHLSSLLNTSTNNDGGNSGDNINAGEIIEELKAQIISSIYPVGSIYVSTELSTKEEVEEKLGGEWEQIKDRFLLSAGDTYEAGTEGGESEHTLTIAEMPKHSHNFNFWIFSGNYGYSGEYYGIGPTNNSAIQGGPVKTSGANPWNSNVPWYNHNTGGSEAHNNMPPYVTVYMWKRVN